MVDSIKCFTLVYMNQCPTNPGSLSHSIENVLYIMEMSWIVIPGMVQPSVYLTIFCAINFNNLGKTLAKLFTSTLSRIIGLMVVISTTARVLHNQSYYSPAHRTMNYPVLQPDSVNIGQQSYEHSRHTLVKPLGQSVQTGRLTVGKVHKYHLNLRLESRSTDQKIP